MNTDQTIEILQAALGAASNGVIITDNQKPDNPIIYTNPGFERLTGYDSEEIIGRNCRFLQGPESNRETVGDLRRAIAAGEFIKVEILNYRKDGTEFWNELSISPVKDEAGKVTHFIGIQDEVTDRVEKERALKAQLMAENIVDTVREPLIILNEDLTVNSVNQSFYNFFQTMPEDIIGRNIYKIEDGHLDIPALRTLIENILPTKNPFDDFGITHEFPRIGVKHLLINARRLERREDRPEYILLAIEDVTRWKENKTALYESERQNKLVIEGLKDVAILTTDTAGRITSWNSGAEKIIGYSDDEILGKPLSILFTSQDAEANIANHEIQLAAGAAGKARDNRWMRRKDGSIYWADSLLAPLYDETGTLQGFAKIINDQTTRKRLEEEIVRRADELAERDQAKDAFLAMLAHELRNPLGAVSNAVQVMQSIDGKRPELERPMTIAVRQIAHMSRLVNDLLDVARVTQGKITLKRKTLALDQIASNVARNLQARANQKNLALKVQTDVDVRIEGDADRLEQIVSNLITNAIKYTDAGEVRVRVTQVDDQAQLVVSDTGVGIEPELLPRIFDLFSQAQQSLARSEGGLGVGLTIVRQLVELHGGQVTAESRGRQTGSNFTVTFPLAETSLSEQEKDLEISAGDRRLRVLIVDDNHDSAEMERHMIELWGYRTEAAHDGEDALVKAAAFAPHVVLLDIGLPKLDGFQVAERLRRTEQIAGVKEINRMKIVAATGYGNEAEVEKTRGTDFNDYLIKPIDFQKLQRLLEDFAGKLKR